MYYSNNHAEGAFLTTCIRAVRRKTQTLVESECVKKRVTKEEEGAL